MFKDAKDKQSLKVVQLANIGNHSQGDPSLAYMAVYDGHGGTGVANYLKDHLHEFILAQPEYRWVMQ